MVRQRNALKGGCPKVCPDNKSCTLNEEGNIVAVEDDRSKPTETREEDKNPFRHFFRGFRRVAEPWQPIVEALTPVAGPGGVVVKGGMWLFRGGKWVFSASKLANGGRRALPVLQRLCFVAGTPVLTRAGLKPIEEIREGDEVVSFNERTKQNEFKRVVQTMERFAEAGRILSVKVDGEAAALGVTAEHPFYVRVHRARDNTASESDDGDWVAAGDLRVEDEIRRADGGWARVESIAHRANGEKVYNFEVVDNHSYFVGQKSLLVHNECITVGQLADKIVSHAFGKHVLKQGEFSGLASTASQLKQVVERVLTNPTATKTLSGGRTAFWDDASRAVVIVNSRNLAKSTVFQPKNGITYFQNLR